MRPTGRRCRRRPCRRRSACRPRCCRCAGRRSSSHRRPDRRSRCRRRAGWRHRTPHRSARWPCRARCRDRPAPRPAAIRWRDRGGRRRRDRRWRAPRRPRRPRSAPYIVTRSAVGAAARSMHGREGHAAEEEVDVAGVGPVVRRTVGAGDEGAVDLARSTRQARGNEDVVGAVASTSATTMVEPK